MPDFVEESTLDGIRFSIQQEQDHGVEVFMLLLMVTLYGFPVGIVAVVLMVLLGWSVGGAIIGLLVTLVLLMLGLGISAQVPLRRRRRVILEIRRGEVVMNGTALPLARTRVLLQRLSAQGRSVLALSAPDSPVLQASGLSLTAEQAERIEAVVDAARRDATARQGGQVPNALHRLRGTIT
jgi:hypothetical protein